MFAADAFRSWPPWRSRRAPAAARQGDLPLLSQRRKSHWRRRLVCVWRIWFRWKAEKGCASGLEHRGFIANRGCFHRNHMLCLLEDFFHAVSPPIHHDAPRTEEAQKTGAGTLEHPQNMCAKHTELDAHLVRGSDPNPEADFEVPRTDWSFVYGSDLGAAAALNGR